MNILRLEQSQNAFKVRSKSCSELTVWMAWCSVKLIQISPHVLSVYALHFSDNENKMHCKHRDQNILILALHFQVVSGFLCSECMLMLAPDLGLEQHTL